MIDLKQSPGDGFCFFYNFATGGLGGSHENVSYQSAAARVHMRACHTSPPPLGFT